MIIIRSLEVNNYRNFKHAKLENLKDLNILIGPNNCGKTNVLCLIDKLRTLMTGNYQYLCDKCVPLSGNSNFRGISINLSSNDFYLKDASKFKTTLKFLLNREFIENIIPGVLNKQNELLEKVNIQCQNIDDTILMENKSNILFGKHFSPFIHDDIIEELKRNILYCPEERLERYKQKEFVTYIREQKLRGSQKRKWIDFINKIVDKKINDEKYETLIRKIDGKDFETSISEQGSGVRSLICLAVDILFSDSKIVLIDEPELGLNPFVKQEFLKFLIEESKQKQIFIATHDPTFINPVIWANKNVNVFFFSLLENDFCRINLAESKEDPDTFAGYMPHTISLKGTHIYVEGSSDVYIFQIFLLKYLNKYEDWIERWNKIGIYHLAGDFWSHLLYTVPNYPYKCLIILDGDKRPRAKEICEKLETIEIHIPKFIFCETIEEIKNALKNHTHPIYCLQKNRIEDYLEPKSKYENINYDKKRDGPKIAEKMNIIPEEISKIFEIVLKK
jgi:AAA15 family ATPase/GTPase